MPPRGELDEICRFWFGSIPSIIWKHDVIHKTRSIQRIALLSEEDWAMAIGNMYRKYGSFREMWADKKTNKKQTDRQTDHSLHPYQWWSKYCDKLDTCAVASICRPTPGKCKFPRARIRIWPFWPQGQCMPRSYHVLCLPSLVLIAQPLSF